jgi:hypothetical protein
MACNYREQMKTRPGTFEFAKYVLVFTTRFRGSTTEVLESYRKRWQVELLFKRLKSLALIGHVPKHDARSSRAWLYGKLLSPCSQKNLSALGATFPPRAQQSRRERPPSARGGNSASPFTISSKPSNHIFPCVKRSFPGIR